MEREWRGSGDGVEREGRGRGEGARERRREGGERWGKGEEREKMEGS